LSFFSLRDFEFLLVLYTQIHTYEDWGRARPKERWRLALLLLLNPKLLHSQLLKVGPLFHIKYIQHTTHTSMYYLYLCVVNTEFRLTLNQLSWTSYSYFKRQESRERETSKKKNSFRLLSSLHLNPLHCTTHTYICTSYAHPHIADSRSRFGFRLQCQTLSQERKRKINSRPLSLPHLFVTALIQIRKKNVINQTNLLIYTIILHLKTTLDFDLFIVSPYTHKENREERMKLNSFISIFSFFLFPSRYEKCVVCMGS